MVGVFGPKVLVLRILLARALLRGLGFRDDLEVALDLWLDYTSSCATGCF